MADLLEFKKELTRKPKQIKEFPQAKRNKPKVSTLVSVKKRRSIHAPNNQNKLLVMI